MLSAPAAQKSIDAALKRNCGQTTAKLAYTPEIQQAATIYYFDSYGFHLFGHAICTY